MDYKVVIKKQATLIIVSVFVMVIAIMGTSYALFLKVDKSEDQVIESGSLVMQLSSYDGSTVIATNNQPIDDNEGLLTKGFSFSVANQGTLDMTYYVALYDNPSDTSTNKLDHGYIKVSLDGGTPFLLSSCALDAEGRRILKRDLILPNKNATDNYKTHNIKVWIDDNTPDSEVGKTVSLKIYAYGEVNEQNNT